MTPRARHLVLLAALALVVLVAWGLAGSLRKAATVFDDVAASSDRPPSLATAPSAGKPNPAGESPAASDPAGDDLVPLGNAPAGGFEIVALTAPGAVVHLRMVSPEPTGFAPLTATAGADGQARFGPMPTPRVPRRALHGAALLVEVDGPDRNTAFGGFLPAWIDGNAIEGRVHEYSRFEVEWDEATKVRRLRIALPRNDGPAVAGRVTTPDGIGIPHVVVYEGDDEAKGVRTKEDGAFRMETETGQRTLRVALLSFGEYGAQLETTVRVPPEGLGGLSLVVPNTDVIEGRALERDGRPAAGAEICLTSAGETAHAAIFSESARSFWGPGYLMRTTTAQDGTFRFVGTLAGKAYDVSWWESQDAARVGAAAVASGARGVELRMDRHGVLPRLVDAAGRTVHGEAEYRLEGSDDEVTLRGRFSPDQDGLLAPPGAKVSIRAHARGYRDVFLVHTVSDRPGLDALEVRMTPSTAARAAVRIRCVDPAGTPLRWPVVRWTEAATGVVLEPGGDRTDDGFTTSTLDPGAYRVRVWDSYGLVETPDHAGLPGSGTLRYVTESELRVDVPATGTKDLTWTLPRGGALRLVFRDASGAAVEYGDMYGVWARDAAGKPTWLRLSEDTTERRTVPRKSPVAPFESQALPAGDYTVVWFGTHQREPPPPEARGRASATVHVTVGETTPVELREPPAGIR